jgi:hypothetical protein
MAPSGEKPGHRSHNHWGTVRDLGSEGTQVGARLPSRAMVKKVHIHDQRPGTASLCSPTASSHFDAG